MLSVTFVLTPIIIDAISSTLVNIDVISSTRSHQCDSIVIEFPPHLLNKILSYLPSTYFEIISLSY